MMRQPARPRGLSAMELVVAVAILGLVAALTLPRAGSARPRPDAATVKDQLDILRIAIERYAYEHGSYPAQTAAGAAPAGSALAFERHLTQETDAAGRVLPDHGAGATYGPYLRGGIPASVAPPHSGSRVVFVVRGRVMPEHDPTIHAAWIYNCDTGEIICNSAERDERGRRLDSY